MSEQRTSERGNTDAGPEPLRHVTGPWWRNDRGEWFRDYGRGVVPFHAVGLCGRARGDGSIPGGECVLPEGHTAFDGGRHYG